MQDDRRAHLVLDPRRAVVVMGVVLAVLVACHALALFILRGPGVEAFPAGAPLSRLLNMDGETNLPAWWSVTLFTVGAVLCACVAAGSREGPAQRWRRHWLLLSGILVFLSIDEGALIHEELSRPLTRAFDLEASRWEFWAWTVPYTALGLLVLVVFGRFMLALPSSTRNHLLVAGAVFVAGAVGMEFVGRELWNPFDPNDGTYLAAVGIEGTLEIIGLTVMVRGLLVHLRDHVGPLRVGWGEPSRTLQEPRRGT